MAMIKVLIVDDNVPLARMIKDGLEQTGAYRVRVENNPLKAHDATLEFEPDIALLDVIMPEKDGGTVAAEIRDDARTANIPIVFLTSIVGKSEAAAMGGKTGKEPVLAKPATLPELIALIEKTLTEHSP